MLLVNSVAPVWDGNETWLGAGGAALFGAFPLAYAVIIDALTIPLTLMLIGLIFRGVAFEFRFKAAPAHRPFWDKAFIGGSVLATFTQGMVVGAVINGFAVSGRAFAGGPFDWFTPFNLFCGLGLVVAYAFLGATWLVMKSENPLQGRMRQVSKRLLLPCWALSPSSASGPRFHNPLSPGAGSACRTCSSCCRFRCWWSCWACGSGAA
ncbi:Cytochrome d ubiquinol oxidase subunit 2 [Leclercia adecarboxylata]|uniref:Cytochrome d ubiquinol oxidase subunit 2 n=1 Tax=Leclercia adecarboxylata TaxID=83655 RepID=A0A4U9HVF7_9ENTR|nr:Cytochrome d ubiquinol oxidase subunit 2 [Leclercia adecarboxylata]